MITSDLQVYKDSFLLFHRTLDICHTLPREYKYSLGEHIINAVSNMMEQIGLANKSYGQGNMRAEYIDEARNCLTSVDLFVRLCFERKSVSHKMYADYTAISVKVGKQLTGWLNSTQGKSRQCQGNAE